MNTSCDPSGNGEGLTYLGSVTTAETDAGGAVSFTFHPDTSHAAAMTLGKVITATATSTFASFDTSEFSACVTVADGSSGAGDIQFTSANYSGSETAGTATISVTRVGGSNGIVTANFSTSNGTAQAPGDYTTVTNSPVIFADGETGPKTVSVTIIDDSIYEAPETVNLALSSTQIASANGIAPNSPASPDAFPHSAVLTITDNDPAPTFSINDVTQNEGQTGTTSFNFTITKSGSTEVSADISYITMNGTATAPSDYNQLPETTITFAANETSKQAAYRSTATRPSRRTRRLRSD